MKKSYLNDFHNISEMLQVEDSKFGRKDGGSRNKKQKSQSHFLTDAEAGNPNNLS